MVNNQIEFNEKHNNKKITEIKITDEYEFEGQLVIENYPNLKKLYLQDIVSIDKITLKDLTKLQECTIWNCDTSDLIIDNCPQIEKLNVRSNLLTNLEFLKDLNNLERLEIDGNTELIKILEPYRRIIQKSNENVQVLEKENKSLNIKYTELKKFLKEKIFVSLSQDAKQGLVNELNKQIKRKGSISAPGRTKELMLNAEMIIDSAKEIKKELEDELNAKSDKILELEKQFKKKEEKINYLESRVQELTDLGKQQKEKIVNAFLQIFSEKDLLQELIKIHLEFIKAKNQKQPVIKLKKQKEKIYNELEEKLNDEEMMEKIETILTDCEELMNQELELETKLDSKVLLIEEKKQILLKIPSNDEEKGKLHQLEIELAKAKTELNSKQEENNRLWEQLKKPTQQIINNTIFSNQFIYQIQYNDERLQKELTELKQKYQDLELTKELSSDPQKLKKTILFLGTKQIFATTRQNTINKLIDICNESNKSNQKYDTIAMVGDYLAEAGEVPVVGGPAKLLGKGTSLVANVFKSRSFTKHAKKIEDYLIDDEKAALFLHETCQSLTNSIQNNQSKINSFITNALKLNQNQFSKYSIFEVGNIQKGEVLSLEKMESTIDLLKQNFREFTQGLQLETNKYAEEMEKLFATEEGKILQTELTELLEKLVGKETEQQMSLKDQIQSKKLQLEKLKNSAQLNLEKGIYPVPLLGEMIIEKWQSRLEKLLDRQAKIIRLEDNEKLTKVKERLREKLTEEEIEGLCQVQIELTKLETVESSSEQKTQTQIQLPPKGNN